MGYNVVRLPRTDIMPLEIIGSRGEDVQRLGSLSDLARPRAIGGYPKIGDPVALPDIAGQCSSKIGAKIGCHLLDGFLGSLGASLGGSLDYSNAQRMIFQFEEVLSTRTPPAEIGDFLRYSELSFDNPAFRPYLVGRNALFVISEVIQSRSLLVWYERRDEQAAVVDLGLLNEIIDGIIEVSLVKGSRHVLRFRGTQRVTFGFKCFEFALMEGDVVLLAPDGGAVVLSTGSSGSAGGALLSGPGGGLLDFYSDGTGS